MKKVSQLMIVMVCMMALVQYDAQFDVAERRSSRGRKAALPSLCMSSDAQLGN